MTRYKSLEDLAAEFERCAEKAAADAREAAKEKLARFAAHKREADTWRAAAILLRAATFSDLGDPPIFRVERDVDKAGACRAIHYRANGLKAVADHLYDLISKAVKDAEQQTDLNRYWHAFGEADGLLKARDILSLVEIEPNLDGICNYRR
jgi:hypothetical protein